MLCLRKSAAGVLAWAFAFWSIQWPGQAFIFRRLEPAATPKHEVNMRTRCTADRQLQRCELALRGGAGNVRQIATLEEFEEVLSESGDTLVCVDFTATWCSPCQQIAPMFEQLSQDLGDVVFVKVDVDENEETAQKYDVFQMPTFLFIRNGEVVDQFSGANEVVLRQKIELLKAGKDGDVIIDDFVQEETKDPQMASKSDLEDDAVDSSNDPDCS